MRGSRFILPPGYKIATRLGEGLTTVVWQVKHETAGEILALKIDTEPNPAHRLQREFAILKRLDLPGVVKVVDSGNHEGRDYFTMELVDGKSITDFMANRRGQKGFVELFLASFQKSVVILSDLHKQGIVHIDVKPSNLLVTKKGDPVLLDFGFAEDYVLSPTAGPSGTTLDYAAPELFTGGSVSPAADIYSLGVIAYEVLSGKKLWEGKFPRELVVAKLKTPPGLGKLDVELPPGLESLILRMLNPDPGLRPSAAEALSEISWLSKEKGVEISTPVMVPQLVFGGREEDMTELERLVFDEKQVVILFGESGVGKTRLLREMRFKSLVDGYNVLHLEGRGAYLSLVDYISSTLDIKHPEINPNSQKPLDKWSRYERVYQGIEKSRIDGVFIDAPVDLTEDEKGLLGYLSRGFDTKLGLILSQVHREVHPEASRVELTDLDEDKVRVLVEQTFGQMKESDRLSLTLVNMAKGNPRRMNELLDVLYKEGWLFWDRGWVYEHGKDEKGLAVKLEDWLEESIEKLDKNSRKVLDMLAVAEGSLPADVVNKVLGEDATLILPELVIVGFIRSFLHRDRPHYEFQNELVRAYIMNKLTTKKKRALGIKLAEALEEFCIRIWSDDVTTWDITYLVQVASLYFKTEANGKISGYLLSAGNRLKSSHNPSKAKELLDKILKIESKPEEKKKALYLLGIIAIHYGNARQAEEFFSQVLPFVEGDPEEKADVLMKIAAAYTRVRDLERGLAFIQKSETCMQAPPARIKYHQIYDRGAIASYQGKLDEAKISFEESLKIAPTPKDMRNSLQGLGGICFAKGEVLKSLDYYREALKLAEEAEDKSMVCETIAEMVNPLMKLERFSEIEGYIEKGLSIADEIAFPFSIALLLRAKSYYLLRVGRSRAARDVTRQGIEISKKLDHKYLIAALQFDEARYSEALGEWEIAERIYRRLWRVHHTITSGDIPPVVLSLWAELQIQKGNFLVGRRMLNKAEKLAESRNDKNRLSWIELGRCGSYLEEKNLVAAAATLEKCKQLLGDKEDIGIKGGIDFYQAEILFEKGETARAIEILKGLKPHIEKKTLENLRTGALRLEGKALIVLQKFEDGLTKLRKSLEIEKSKEDLYEQAVTLFAIAEAMFKHHDYSEDAISALEEAQTIFERLGARHYLMKVRELREKYADKLKHEEGLSPRYLKGLKEVNDLIAEKLGQEGFMRELLSITLDVTKAERGVVYLAEGKELHLVASENIDPSTFSDAERISTTILNQTVSDREPVFSEDVLADERFNRTRSIILNKIRSFICVPLKSANKMIGTMYLDGRKSGLFNTSNLVYFETLGNLLASSLERSVEFRKLREEFALARDKQGFEGFGVVLGQSRPIKKIYGQLEQVAKSDTNLLIEGETGTGKGVLARLIHERSERREKQFFSINCGVLPEGVFESELFGCRKGAFTGAIENRKGLLEAADGSTVFFDEITNTSPSMQAKLLEVIEEKVVRRMGESQKRKVDLRFIFATNRNLEEEVREGRFREDLYYRVNIVTVKLPALRECKEDIPEFIDFFLRKPCARFNGEIIALDEEARQALVNYPWPGNVRELKGVLERLSLMVTEPLITREILDEHFRPGKTAASKVTKSTVEAGEEVLDLEQARVEVEKEMIRKALARCPSLDEAAKALGISKRSLSRKKKLFGL